MLDQKSGKAVPCLTTNLLEPYNLESLDPQEEEDIKCVSGVLYAGKPVLLPYIVVELLNSPSYSPTFLGAVDTVGSPFDELSINLC